MASLNSSGSGHGSKTETYSDGSTIAYNVFPANYEHLEKVRQAMRILDNLAAREPENGRCNSYFKSLSAGSTFSGLWQRAATWVNYSPSVAVGFYAAMHSNDLDMTLTSWCCSSQNRWMIAATMCHELAHAAGAPGGASHAAELAADRCYFGDQYDSTILGSVDGLYRYLRDQDTLPA